ncbi:MAG TPA: signal peptidase II [Casimicrobiaceae bacterium]|nr:signal peptidase II [Casimicrobiaceae bacterium]
MSATSNRNADWWKWLLLAAAVIFADRLSKMLVVNSFLRGEELPVTSFMSFVLAYNSGAAFSFLAGQPGWQRWFFTAVAIVASVFLVYMIKRGGDRIQSAGFALILGGALGNLWDRIAIGKVVDFLLFHYAGWSWPAFNVADSAITVGAALLIIDSFRQKRAELPMTPAKDP